MKIAQIKAKIISNQRIKSNYWQAKLLAPGISKNALPGQFINIKVSDGFKPLLRRPLGIHGASAGKLEILYEVVGPGTEALSKKKRGEYLDIIGPLGNGFDYRRAARVNILVAGGMGVAPLVFLAEKLKKGKPLVLIGAATEKEISCVKEFKALGCRVEMATDDGSMGFHGRVTELLSDILRRTTDLRVSTIYACGPGPMLKAVAKISREYKIRAQLSLEAHMACGIGACLGCVVNTKAGYKRACKDGPVFDADTLIW